MKEPAVRKQAFGRMSLLALLAITSVGTWQLQREPLAPTVEAPQPFAPGAVVSGPTESAPAPEEVPVAYSPEVFAPLPGADALAPAVAAEAGGENHAAPADRPLDRLEITATVAEEWPEGFPGRAGWHPRVRIVETTYKSGLLRIEEQVEVELTPDGIRIIRTVIEKAVDARHLLVSSDHLDALEVHGIAAQAGRNPAYMRVAVDQPRQIGALPELAGRLAGLSLRGVEPDAVIEAAALPADPLVGTGAAWHLDNLGLLAGYKAGADIGAAMAWDRRTDASGVLIAVIDSGIASSDPELAQSIWFMPGETFGDGLDSDGNGYIDDVFGYDFVHDDPDPEDETGHGSMCAALMAAAGNNGLGSAGVAWKASILNCKFLDRNGLGALSDAIDAIDYARAAGAGILNLSWSYFGEAPLLAEVIGRCDAEGILMVCAAGNSGFAAPVPAPASLDFPHLVAVAASTPADTVAPFSVINTEKIDLAAPGIELPVALSNQPWNPTGSVRYASGTSFSAALVSGGLALGLAEFPADTPLQVLRRMLETVDPLPGGAAAMTTGGRLNVGKMLADSSDAVPHDHFDDRRILTDAVGQWTGRNSGAGVEANDLNFGLIPAPLHTLWFEWTAPTDGLLRIEALAEGQSVRLALFDGAGTLPGNLLGTANSGTTFETAVTAGQRLFWMLDSDVPIDGGLSVRWHLPPPDDNWQDAATLAGIPLSVSGNSLGATIEGFEQDRPHRLFLTHGSIWYKWTSGSAGIVKATVSDDHAVFILPLDTAGRPTFPALYEMSDLIQDQRRSRLARVSRCS